MLINSPEYVTPQSLSTHGWSYRVNDAGYLNRVFKKTELSSKVIFSILSRRIVNHY